MRKSCAVLGVSLGIVLASAGAWALEPPDYMRANFGVLVESHLNPDFAGNVSSPSINFSLGAGINYPLAPESPFSFAPSAQLYGYYGEFNSGQPVAADQAFSSTYIVGLMLNAPIMYTTPIGESDFTFSGGAGLCLDLRLALKSGDIPASDSSDSADTAASDSNFYFWSEGRFLVPSTTLDVDYRLSDRIYVGLLTRILWPIYNLWTGEGYGFLDQTKYIINVSLRYKLKPKGGEPSPSVGAPAGAPAAAPKAPPAQ